MKNYTGISQKWLRVYIPKQILWGLGDAHGFNFWFGSIVWGEESRFSFKLPYFMIVWNNY